MSYFITNRNYDLKAPAHMRAAARQALKTYGDSVETRAITEGNMSATMWVKLHKLLSESGEHSEELHMLGVGASKRAMKRTFEYVEEVIAKLEEENRTLISVEAKDMAKIETRTNTTERFDLGVYPRRNSSVRGRLSRFARYSRAT